jgi:hypothetical protein
VEDVNDAAGAGDQQDDALHIFDASVTDSSRTNKWAHVNARAQFDLLVTPQLWLWWAMGEFKGWR